MEINDDHDQGDGDSSVFVQSLTIADSQTLIEVNHFQY